MAATTQTNAMKLEVPVKLLQKSSGFSIDIGGSVIKIVYLAKDEWREQSTENKLSEKGNLYMISFARDELKDAIRFLKKNAYVRREVADQMVDIFCTGIGSNTFATMLNNELNIRLKNTLEFDDFIMATDFLLKNYPDEQVLLPVPIKCFELAQRELRGIIEGTLAWRGMEAVTKLRMRSERIQLVKEYSERMSEIVKAGGPVETLKGPVRYPYLLGQFGSAFVFLKVQEDGAYNVPEFTPLGGRTFLDLGCLLTGVKTYQDLISLAAEGKTELNTRMQDVIHNVKDDVYSTGIDDCSVVFNFGGVHGQTLEEVDKADLARTLLQNICANTMNIAFHTMIGEKCPDLYLAGSFVNSPVTQELLTKEFELSRLKYTELQSESPQTVELNMRIIQNGGYLGALGSFLFGCQEH